jgi:hypothetical protein
MKISRRKGHAPSRLVLLLVLCLAVFAPSLFPMTAQAVSRKESSEPLLGDPDGPDQSPRNGPAKATAPTARIRQDSTFSGHTPEWVMVIRVLGSHTQFYWVTNMIWKRA